MPHILRWLLGKGFTATAISYVKWREWTHVCLNVFLSLSIHSLQSIYQQQQHQERKCLSKLHLTARNIDFNDRCKKAKTTTTNKNKTKTKNRKQQQQNKTTTTNSLLRDCLKAVSQDPFVGTTLHSPPGSVSMISWAISVSFVSWETILGKSSVLQLCFHARWTREGFFSNASGSYVVQNRYKKNALYKWSLWRPAVLKSPHNTSTRVCWYCFKKHGALFCMR